MSLIDVTVEVDLKPEYEEDLRACRGCLATDTNLYDLQKQGVAQIFGHFTGITVGPSDGYPQLVCTFCLHLLRKFNTFRTRCHTSMWNLQQMRINNQNITTDSLKAIDRNLIELKLIQTPVLKLDIQGDIENKDIEDFIKKIDQIVEEDSTSEDEVLKPIKKPIVKRKKRITKKDIDQKNYIEKVSINETNDTATNDEKNELELLIKDEIVDKIDDVTSEPDLFNDTTTDVDDSEIKDEIKEEKDFKRSSVKRKPVRKPKIRKRVSKKTADAKEENLDGVWATIVKEINEENCSNKNTKRKVPARSDITFLKNKAEMFSNTYNVEVTFFSKEELKSEIEEKRNSDNYKNAAFKCELCCKVFLVEETYTRHMVTHDPSNGEFECEICHYRFNARHRFTNHYNRMHSRKFACKSCGLINRSWTAAKRHFLWHKQGELNTIKCEYCDMQFAIRKNYLMHIRNKHGVGGTRCLLCDRAFIGVLGLKVHMDKSHRKAANCSVCNSVFHGAEVLAVHEQLGGCRKGVSACPTCGVNFVTENEMRSHYDEQHKKTLLCTQCNRVFDNEDKYLNHTRGHEIRNKSIKVSTSETKVKLLQSDTSKSVNIRNGIFRSRVANDKNNKNANSFVCEVCGKASKCYAMLRYHQRVHTGEKPFQCDICHKSFHQMSYLTNHIRTHTDERRYKCHVCSKAFRQQAHRTAHMLTHTKERPYACPACPKRYTGQSALKDHTNTAHLGLPPRKWGKAKTTT